jgi:CheY-like chemotaxis protein
MENISHEILVVDDDPIIVAVLRNFLIEAGFKVASAENGQVAFELLKKYPHRFSVIILDRMMPVLSGIDFLHKIYVIDELRQIPIIMLTSHAERDDVGAAVIAGVFDFLFKPIDKDLLLLVIKRALRSRVS